MWWSLNALTTYAEAKYCTIYCDQVLSDCLNLCVCLCVVSNAIKQQDKCTCAFHKIWCGRTADVKSNKATVNKCSTM